MATYKDRVTKARQTGFFRSGPFGIPAVAIALCEDGVIRTVRLNEAPDTFFSWPGRTTIKGKTVTGFVSTDTTAGLVTFYANKHTPTRKEANNGPVC